MTTPPVSAPRPLLALIGGHVCLHGAMAGIRMAAPLLALRQGHQPWAVGLLLALFAVAAIALALPAGRLADRHGYHVPMHLAVALTLVGGIVAAASQHIGALCVAAVLTGAGTNLGLIAIQRTAGRMARGPTERLQMYSWLGLAPALANVVGPVLAGVLIDLAGFRTAFVALALLPLGTFVMTRVVPRETPADGHGSAMDAGDPQDVVRVAGLPALPGDETRGAELPAPAADAPRANADAGTGARPAGADPGQPAPRRGVAELLARPGMRRLLLINWLIAASWDMHAFLVPVLGHERHLSASAIGLVLGAFALSVAAVRLLIPLLAHRMRDAQVLGGAMLLTALVFAVYPFAGSALTMAACAVVLGQALGVVQPMVLTTLHRITPVGRQGEAIALRTMTLNLSSTGMPLLFGLVGTTVGAAALFWSMAAALGAGSSLARRLRPT